jgi:hypothetical protein
VTSVGIDDLINEGVKEVVFEKSLVEVTEVCENSDGALFFVDENRIGNPRCLCNGVYEASCT